MLKTELHAHTSADPEDYIPYSTTELIDRAAELEYHALAVTLHDRHLDIEPLRRYAADRGVTLIDGIERKIEGKHVLLLNFGDGVEDVDSFETLAALKRARPAGLVIAPHAFYPTGVCLGRLLDRHQDLFDAVEVNGFYTAAIDYFNDKARGWARRHGKPAVGNGDIHRLRQLGRTFSLVDAAPDPDAICSAIRAGKVEARTTPLSTFEASAHLADLLLAQLFRSPQRPAGTLVQPAAAESPLA
jgi:predicted metal-dependent phosphoesterase TrpH